MHLKLLNLFNQLRSSYWFIPSLMCLCAFGLAHLAHFLDELYATSYGQQWPKWLIYQGGIEGARTILSTVAGSMITVAGVTFSVTVVALSMASSQYGPRLLVSFMRDKSNQFVLGTFVSTFLYGLLALGSGDAEVGLIPAASATIGLLTAGASVLILTYFMHHVSTTMRAEHVVKVVAEDVEKAITKLIDKSGDDECPHEASSHANQEVDSSHWHKITAHRDGYIQAIDESALINLAKKWNTRIQLLYRPGHFVCSDAQTLLIENQEHQEELQQKLTQYLIIGSFRTDDQDPEYGINQLVEVASRALSPGINDPITALACIDWLNSALYPCGSEPLPPKQRFDDDDNLRLICNPITYAGLIESAFNQIRQNGCRVPAVAIRLMEVFYSLAETVSTKERADSLRTQANALVEGCKAEGMLTMDLESLEARHQKMLRRLNN